MKTHRFAINVTVLLLSTFVTAQAAVAESDAGGTKASGLVVGVRVIQPNLVVGKSARLNIPTPRLSRRARARLASLMSRGCGCPLTQDDQDALGSCWKTCVTSWGVSYGSLTACGAVCVGAATGNPAAIAVCAGCLGTGEWILAGCALYCAWGGGGGGHGILQQDPQARLLKRSLHSTRI